MSDVEMELSMGSTKREEAPPKDPFAFDEPVSPVSKGIAEMSQLLKNCPLDEHGLALPSDEDMGLTDCSPVRSGEVRGLHTDLAAPARGIPARGNTPTTTSAESDGDSDLQTGTTNSSGGRGKGKPEAMHARKIRLKRPSASAAAFAQAKKGTVEGTTEEVVGHLLLQPRKYEALVVELKENLVAAEDRAEQLQQRLRKSGQRPARAEEEPSPVRVDWSMGRLEGRLVDGQAGRCAVRAAYMVCV